MKIRKVGKLATNFHRNEEHVTYKKNLKQVLNHRLILKQVRRTIKFKKSLAKIIHWHKRRAKQKVRNDFEKDFSSW